MVSRKVLLATYHFPPSAAVAVYRMLGLVRYLPRFGWEPLVVAPPHVPHEPDDPALIDLVPPETTVVHVPFAQGWRGKLARHIAPMNHWLPKAWRACRQVIREHKPDAILTSSPPGSIHCLGLALQWQTGLPWLACFRDPWVVNQLEETPSFQQHFQAMLEAQTLKRANVIIANTPLNQHGLQNAYPRSADKIVTITNGFDPEKFARPAFHRIGNPLTVLHAGELYTGRDPRPLLDALVQVQADRTSPRLQIQFLGRSTESLFDLDTEVAQRRLEQAVAVEGQVPYAQALDRMMRSDILLLLHRPDYPIGVPAKLYEYLGTGRPILALAEPEGDVAWALKKSGVLHRVVPPRDVGRIRQALVELSRAVAEGTPVVGDEAALATFTREHMARRFAECLDACADATASTQPRQLVTA